jgi:hypothetical protein
MRRTMIKLNHDNWDPDQEKNPEQLQYEAELVTTRSWFSSGRRNLRSLRKRWNW